MLQCNIYRLRPAGNFHQVLQATLTGMAQNAVWIVTVEGANGELLLD